MKFLPLLKTCIKALVRNPMRAALTILGIIIGIAAVIAMVEIGQGSTLQIKSTIASMGADTLNIRPGAISKSGVNTGAGGRASLTNADCEAIMKDCPMVLRATPVVRASGQVIYGNKNWSPETVEGGSVEYLKIKSWYDMERGQPFSDEDVEQARRVCVIGQTVAKELFGDEDPLGKDIRIKNVMFKVIGILKKKGANMMGRDQDDSIILPWTSIRYRLQGLGGGSTSASSSKSTTTFNRADKYTSSSVDYYTETTDQPYTDAPHPRRFNNIDFIMAQIAVGGVGIMNIMLVSVTERTKEIGLRMAVGARPQDIMRQFLLEAVLLCVVGGALGILLGKAISTVVSRTMNWATASSPEAMVLAVGVSVLIGLVFGWYPSWKASKMDPIDALRHE